jgi:hypothetical protein
VAPSHITDAPSRDWVRHNNSLPMSIAARRPSAVTWRSPFSRSSCVKASRCRVRLRGEAVTLGISVSVATVYNTPHQFTEAGLLCETVVEPGRSYFDTNTADHHHFFCEATGKLHDIPAQQL